MVNPTLPDPLDCLVVGAGPAGLTAGLYLRRFLRDVVIADTGNSRARAIPASNNYPGFPRGIGGEALLARLRDQLTQAGGSVTAGMVSGLRAVPGVFEASVDGRRVQARTVVLATGVCNLEPTLPGIDALKRDNLLRQCPICDAFEFAGKRMGVIGGGSHCVREAIFLRHFSDDVVAFGASEDAQLSDAHRRELERNGIAGVAGYATEVTQCDAQGVSLRMSDGSTLHVEVLYAALGSQPQSQLAVEIGAQLDELGNVVVDSRCQTSVSGVYAIGDIVSGLDQLAVAAGHAAIAATAIHNRLRDAQRVREIAASRA